MVFLVDDGSEFDAPLDRVWRYVGSGSRHSEAHRHRAVRRRRFRGNSGRYSWEQEFDGRTERFSMRWVAFPPAGIAYEVLDGPFRGSAFFLYYVPRGRRTGVVVAGNFVSPTLPERRIAAAVDRFFGREFEQDAAALASERRSPRPDRLRRTAPRTRSPRSRSPAPSRSGSR